MTTTEIIDWIKKNISQSAVDEHFEEWKEAVEFLDSLKEKQDG